MTVLTLRLGRKILLIAFATMLTSACREQLPADENGVEQQSAFHSDGIAVTVRGSGPDVILVPGLAAGPDVWNDLSKRLEGGKRVHLVQIAGFAGLPAGGPSEGAVLRGTADEIARYIKEARLGRPALIGHSMGGAVGILVAAEHPGSLSKLMTVDTIPSMADVMSPGQPDKLPAIAEQQKQAMSAGQPGKASTALSQMVDSMATAPDDRKLLLDLANRSDPIVVGDAIKEMILTDLRGRLGAITIPVEVIYTTPAAPGMTPQKADAAFRQAYQPVKNLRLQRIEGSKHYIMLDQPAAFATAVESFLSKR